MTSPEVKQPQPEGKVQLIAHFPPPVIDIKQREVSAYLTVNNQSEDTLKLYFNSSKQFDIELIDNNHQIIARWSSDKRFMMALQTINIAAKQSQCFGDSLKLLQADGSEIPAGDYHLKITITAQQIPGTGHHYLYSAQTALTIGSATKQINC